MRTVYETQPVAVPSVAAGSYVVVPIQCPSRSRLVRMNIVQSDGLATEGFQAALYNALVTATPQLADELYRCTDFVTGTAGSLVEFFDGIDRYFFSHDADQFTSFKGRTIYLRLENTGTVAHTYNVVLAAEDQS